jgi:flavodoxin
MKSSVLVVFYSRTGTTKKVVEFIFDNLLNKCNIKCDIEEIIDTKKRDGVLGYLLSGRDSILKKLTVIKKIKKNPASYDIVIVGTPVWAFNVSTPIRTYLSQNKKHFKKIKKGVAFFCTYDNSGSKRVFREMEILSGKRPIALLELKKKEVVEETYTKKVERFIDEILKKQTNIQFHQFSSKLPPCQTF